MSQVNNNTDKNSYWKENLRIIWVLMIVWFLVSFVCGILLVEPLNHIKIGGYKLGFWFAQQGSIYAFLILIYVYVRKMAQLDRKYGMDNE